MRRFFVYGLVVLLAIAAGAFYWFANRTIVVGRANIGDSAPPIPQRVSLIGQRAPRFSKRDRVVVVNMWAPWCRPCMDEMPRIENEIWRRYRPNVDVIGVALGENEKGVSAFKRNGKVTFPLVADGDRKISHQFAADHLIPQTFVMNRSGTIVYQTQGYSPATFDHLLSAIDRAVNSRD